ncbi:glycosyltransferase 61 family protein [Aliiroseovarius sp.]|uniref:glycosyltransferase family 61 protein n=1 Tax=Aliiroseovarius sp. TaxID=1872442 RepID=UPI002630D98E|nr:glycosyltransferase 61 family protein [Aliiroseovarius sp.]
MPGQKIDERACMTRRPQLVAELASGQMPTEDSFALIEPRRETPQGPVGQVLLFAARNVTWHARSGRLDLPDGSLAASLSGQGGRRDRPGPRLRLKRASLWLTPGARANYGHFLFDGMTGLNVLEATGIAEHFQPFTPRLSRWQRDLLTLGGLRAGPGFRSATVEVEELVWLSSMNHYLHRNDGLLRDVVARLPRAEAPGEEVLYLSRRGFTGRIMTNEPALERALQARGVRILHPQRLSVAEQVSAMARARMVIGPAGAALANLVFLAPGARVVELRPEPVNGPWIEIACANLGLRHHLIDAPETQDMRLSGHLAQLPRRLTGRYNVAYEVNIVAVLDRLGSG